MTTDTYDGFHLERDADSGIATLTLDVPEKMNRVSMAARDQLARLFGELGADDTVRVIVIGGAGEKAFTAGGDIPGFMTRSPEELSHLAENIGAAERCPKPVVAKLHGFTFGVGLELALACDLRVAADDTVLGLPEITLGMIPGSGGTQRLAHLVGLSRAKDAILRGRRIPAAEALQWGLVAEVVPRAELDGRTTEIALELAAKAPLALKVAKRVLNLAYDTPLHVGLELEGLAYGLLRSTDDFAEGVAAFAERRPPKYTGS
ncbi:MAG TPA: enoyl-CoA hydratase-related protein [Acidimicrobiia bacterium]|nr:enoyl-CoA hydratase-related protein [Acidimicrobiia bacterium]